MRVLVTGADGFVGRHLCRFLEGCGDSVAPVCGSKQSDAFAGAPVLDVRDGKAFERIVSTARPDAIVHLAAASSVARSHTEPAETFEVNALGAVNLCVAARAVPGVRVLLVSSGEVYGPAAPGEAVGEQAPYAPMNPYSSAKVAAEIAGFQFARSYGLHVVCARPFNHLGAGQSPMFVIPSLARQVAEAKRSGERAVLRVGNLDPVRDFSHVRDVIAAYRLLLERGVSGEAYNVCSGVGRSVRSVLDELAERAGVEVDIHLDPSKLRPAEIPRMVGNPAKIRGLGWTPRFTVGDALCEILAEASDQDAEASRLGSERR